MSSTESPDQAAVRLKCDAPRVSQADLEANIVYTEYVKHTAPSGQVLRWCVLTVKNGFAITGEPSAAASAANDRQELGEKIARENAIRELWKVMGYELKQRLFVAPPAKSLHPSFEQLQDMPSHELSRLGYGYAAYEGVYFHRDGAKIGPRF